MDKIQVKVTGGNLVASVIPDPNYPGIDISYEPDDSSALTGLAVVEEYDHVLRLCDYRKMWEEEPEITEFEYDTVFMEHVAYVCYLESKKGSPVKTFSEFLGKEYRDENLMRSILPGKLFQRFIELKIAGGIK